MPVSPVFQAIIAATDSASGPLRAVAAAFVGLGEKAGRAGAEAEHAARGIEHAEHASEHAGHAAEHAAHDMEHAGHAAEHAGHGFFGLAGHVHLLRENFGELHATVGEFSENLTELLPALGALGAAGSVAGLFELAEHVSEARSEFLKTSKVLGVSAEYLQQFNYAAGQVDVSTDTAATALTRFNRAIAESASGHNKNAAALFHHLNIALKDSHGHLKSIEDLLPQLADAFAHTADPAMRTSMAMTLFGRAGAELLPLLIEGSKGLEEMSERAKQLTYQFSEADNKGLEEYHRSVLDLQTAVGGFTNMLGAKLAPTLQPVVEMATEWVVANRDWIATGITDKVGTLATWISHLHLKEIVERSSQWAHTTLDVVNALGGMKTVLAAVAFAMASPFITPAIALLTMMKEIGVVALIDVPYAFGALIASMVGVEGAWEAFGAVFAANPFGIVLAAAAALGTAAYVLWDHWDSVKKHFENLFTWFSSQNGWVQALVTITAPFLGLPLLIMDNWTPIKDFFLRLWDGVTEAFRTAWDAIKPIVDALREAADLVRGTLTPGVALPGGGALRFRSLPSTPAVIPRAPLGPAAAATAAGAPGRVQVDVNFRNLPPGANANVRGSGPVETRVNTGQTYPDGDLGMDLMTGP